MPAGAQILLHRRSVAVDHPPIPDRRHPVAGDDGAHQVERIGGVQSSYSTGAAIAPHPAEMVDRLRERVLLTGEPGHKATAAHQPSRLKPTERPHDLPPWN